MPALPIDTDQIVITASRAPESEAQTPASVTIIDQQRIERLDEPLVGTLASADAVGRGRDLRARWRR